jgi:hypothetical protein
VVRPGQIRALGYASTIMCMGNPLIFYVGRAVHGDRVRAVRAQVPEPARLPQLKQATAT